MKVITLPQSPKFTPITIEITIESLDELKALWMGINIQNNSTLKLWDTLGNLLSKQ